jgi:hypothetical protein
MYFVKISSGVLGITKYSSKNDFLEGTPDYGYFLVTRKTEVQVIRWTRQTVPILTGQVK